MTISTCNMVSTMGNDFDQTNELQSFKCLFYSFKDNISESAAIGNTYFRADHSSVQKKYPSQNVNELINNSRGVTSVGAFINDRILSTDYGYSHTLDPHQNLK